MVEGEVASLPPLSSPLLPGPPPLNQRLPSCLHHSLSAADFVGISNFNATRGDPNDPSLPKKRQCTGGETLTLQMLRNTLRGELSRERAELRKENNGLLDSPSFQDRWWRTVLNQPKWPLSLSLLPHSPREVGTSTQCALARGAVAFRFSLSPGHEGRSKPPGILPTRSVFGTRGVTNEHRSPGSSSHKVFDNVVWVIVCSHRNMHGSQRPLSANRNSIQHMKSK